MRDDASIDNTTSRQRTPDELSRRQLGALTLAAGITVVLPAARAATHTPQPVATPPVSRNIAIYRRFIERGFNHGDLSFIDEIAAQKYQEHEYLAPTDLPGPETLKTGIRAARQAILGLELTIEDIAEVDDKVWARLLCHGRDPASGKPIVMTVMDLCRFADGKIVEHWGVPDRFALLHQLGLLPPGAA